jgi:hypothetical protein
MQIPEKFLTEYSNLKLSDFDLDNFNINTPIFHQINNIKSEEIRTFCQNIVNLQKTICDKDFNPSDYNITIKSYEPKYFTFQIQHGIGFQLQNVKSPRAKKLFFEYLNIKDQLNFLNTHYDWYYISLLNYKQKSYILKYMFAKQNISIQKSDLECIKEHRELLIELLELCINTNNEDNLRGLLENIETNIITSEYKQLQYHAQKIQLFNLTAILIEYEYLDKIKNYNNYDIKVSII